MFLALRAQAEGGDIDFHGEYTLPVDPLVTDKERVQLVMREAWRVTGYRFTVNFHQTLVTGHKTRAWCSQDANRKKPSKKKYGPEIQNRETVGMERFECQSHLGASCKDLRKGTRRVKLITLNLRHHQKHVLYYNVAMPDAAAEIIRENLEWSTPASLVPKVQAAHPQVTAAQIHRAWAEMSEEIWKRDPKQVESARRLLEEHRAVVDIFEVETAPGVEQICWGMKVIAGQLTSKTLIVEIAIDATSDAITPGKRTDALEKWSTRVRDAYKVYPRFINVDKDLAEIGMAHRVWPDARIQICGWHMKKAVRERITKAKLSTTPYKAAEAHNRFSFIDPTFIPPGRADPGEREGGREGGGRDTCLDEPDEATPVKPDPNALYIRFQPTQKPGLLDPDTAETVSLVEQTQTNTTGLKIRIPALRPTQVVAPEEPKRVFCPQELREPVLAKVMEHRNAHPLLPGKSAPTAEGIYSWAVKKMYQFCKDEDLPEMWAYLWENWYRPERWKLWARSVVPEIPRLNTTMIMESHWRHIKHDFLHHFSKPRIDLLAWILITKLGPSYYRKLDVLLGDIGRYRSVSAWRKPFKKLWRECEKKQIPEPTGVFEYRTDVKRWVCTCPALAKSRFLICKHLVQAVKPVPPEFFLQVTRNRTAPVWSHPSLVPRDDLEPLPDIVNEPEREVNSAKTYSQVNDEDDDGNSTDDEDDYQGEVEQRLAKDATYQERMERIIRDLHSFADGLQYQTQFRDERFLTRLEVQGRGFLSMMDSCLEKERRENSSRIANPGTWNPEFTSAMFYRSRLEDRTEGRH
ncbi:hypothetical protein V5O48_017915 [Marasmius crinis-equi]|uniref:SWIM-type domain-containing protein n=1 Tax=Marasmius crinis-equi TaxID=585013 RepID=A0ABR3EMN3_9AGAR